MRAIHHVCMGFILLTTFATGTSAGVYRVKADAAGTPHDGSTWDRAFTTVQAGINAAASGDQVWVAQGTYVGKVTTRDGVALLGGYAGSAPNPDERDWVAHPTVLDGNHAGSVVTVPASANPTTVIEGFTVTNGTGTAPTGYSAYGGGVYCGANSAPRIANCVFTANVVSSGPASPGSGGAVYFSSNCSGSVENCDFAGNIALYGGAIFTGDRNPSIRNCTFTNNSAYGSGGAISVLTDCYSTITGNTFTGNTASNGGGAIYCDSLSNPTIEANVFNGNSSMGSGGAVQAKGAGQSGYPCRLVSNLLINNAGGTGDAIYADGVVEIVNNTIAMNRPYQVDQETGALYFASVYRVYNNILLSNGTAIGHLSASTSTTYYHNNCFYGNALDHDAKTPDVLGTNGNFSADPRLVNVAGGDYHLTGLSPCVDAGNAAYILSGDTDLDGQMRKFGAAVDVGAYELVPRLAFTVQPGSGPKGSPLLRQPVVSAQDAAGTVYSLNTGTVTVALSSGTGTPGAALLGTTTASFINGVATFTNLGVDTGGTGYSLTASSPGLSGALSTIFSVTIPRVYVSSSGSDTNEGSSWALAKASVGAALLEADPAQAGEVWVRTGTYSANATVPAGISLLGGFRGRESSSDGRIPAEFITTLSAQASGPVVRFGTGSGRTTVLDGFTITGGNGAALGTGLNTYRAGGGVYVKGTSPTITHNVIVDNSATIGGGIAVDGGSPLIQYNRIVSNGAACNSRITGGGGGIALVGTGTAEVLDNLIANNAGTGTNPLLGEGARGGGIACATAGPTIRNNTIAANTATASGGAIYLTGASPAILNNIIALNQTGVHGVDTSRPTFSHNVFHSNGAYNTLGVTNPVGVNGNFAADPLFVSAGAKDYHIATASPCVNAGINESILKSETDLDGAVRIIGGTVDVGAYEVTEYRAVDVQIALRTAAGIRSATSAELSRLDLAPDGGDGRVALADAVRIVRMVAGLEPNP